MATRKIRPYATLQSTALADGIGALDVQLREMQTRMKAYKDEWSARNLTCVEGLAFTVLKSEVERETFDIGRAREVLGEEVLAPFYRAGVSAKFTIKASEQLAKAA